MDLPNDLRVALAHELETIPLKSTAEAATRLSSRYRGEFLPSEMPFLHSPTDVAAYAAYRMPATYAAVHAAFVEVRKRRPGWQPRTLLDAGSGPGTAIWAANQVWPNINEITLLERDEAMMAFGKHLARQANAAALRQANWKKVDLLGKWDSEPQELVTTTYVLGELPQAKREAFINKLWSITMDTLVIIEPGTPVGFAHIRQARQDLIAAGALVIAPCPHNLSCPMSGNDWCHFAQRISRTQLHRQVKKAVLSYEDEKFSYVVLSRIHSLPIGGRVIRHPQIRPGHIHLELCTPEGLQTTVVTRKNKGTFREARNLRWGDSIPQ